MKTLVCQLGLALALVALNPVAAIAEASRSASHEMSVVDCLRSGFDPEFKNLYCLSPTCRTERWRWAQLGMVMALVNELAPSQHEDSDPFTPYSWDRTSDGTTLRLWNSRRTKAVLLTLNGIRVVQCCPGTYLNDNNQEVGREIRVTSDAGAMWFFVTTMQHKVRVAYYAVDNSGRFLCTSGQGKIRIYSMPSDGSVNHVLSWDDEYPGTFHEFAMFSCGTRLYLVDMRDENLYAPMLRMFEVRGDDLAEADAQEIRLVWRFGRPRVVDLDCSRGQLLLQRQLDWAADELFYIYDCNERTVRRIGHRQPFAYLDPSLFRSWTQETLQRVASVPATRPVSEGRWEE